MIKKYFLILVSLFAAVLCGPPKPGQADKNAGHEEKEIPMRDISEVIRDLDSAEWSVRSQAAVEAGSRGLKEALPKLRKLFSEDKNPAVRGSSALALADLKDNESVPAILKYMKDEPEDSPEVYIEVLKRMGNRQAGKALIPYLNSELDVTRLLAVDALATLETKEAGAEILKMAEKNKSVEKHKTFAMALGKLGIKEAENYLIGLAEKTEPSPTLAASILALGRIKSRKGVTVLSGFIGKPFDKGRENAADALIMIQDRSCLPMVYSYLLNHDKEIRYIAARTVAEIPDPASADKVLEILSGKDPVLFGAAAYTAGRLKAEKTRKKIEEILSKKDTPEREMIAQSLGWIGNKESIPVLVSVLQETGGEGRYGAAWSLGIMEAKEAFEDLKKAASSSDGRLASIALESLGMLKMEESLDFLEKNAKSSKGLALFSIGSISNIPGEKARKVLEEFAKSKELNYFQPAIEALGKRKEKESVPFLVSILKDKDSTGKLKMTIAALTSITGDKFRSSTEWINKYGN